VHPRVVAAPPGCTGSSSNSGSTTSRYEALLAASSDITLVDTHDGQVSYLSPSASRLLGVPLDDLRSADADALIGGYIDSGDAAKVRDGLAYLMDRPGAERTARFRVDVGGHARDVEAVARNLCDDRDVQGLLVTLRDVSERTDLERALTEQAFSDELTGLPNRALLRERTDHALRIAARRGDSSAHTRRIEGRPSGPAPPGPYQAAGTHVGPSSRHDATPHPGARFGERLLRTRLPRPFSIFRPPCSLPGTRSDCP
jgi:PAS domain S-box-containing protein